MECRMGCSACCIAPSISSPIPGMPEGKPAGLRCVQLSEDGKCLIFGSDKRPSVCSNLPASEEMCGKNRFEALAYLEKLEQITSP